MNESEVLHIHERAGVSLCGRQGEHNLVPLCDFEKSNCAQCRVKAQSLNGGRGPTKALNLEEDGKRVTSVR